MGYLDLCLVLVLGMGHCAIGAHPVLANSLSLCLALLRFSRWCSWFNRCGDVAFARPEARSHAHGAKVYVVGSTVASRAKLVFTGNEGVSSRLSSTVCLWCLGPSGVYISPNQARRAPQRTSRNSIRPGES